MEKQIYLMDLKIFDPSNLQTDLNKATQIFIFGIPGNDHNCDRSNF